MPSKKETISQPDEITLESVGDHIANISDKGGTVKSGDRLSNEEIHFWVNNQKKIPLNQLVKKGVVTRKQRTEYFTWRDQQQMKETKPAEKPEQDSKIVEETAEHPEDEPTTQPDSIVEEIAGQPNDESAAKLDDIVEETAGQPEENLTPPAEQKTSPDVAPSTNLEEKSRSDNGIVEEAAGQPEVPTLPQKPVDAKSPEKHTLPSKKPKEKKANRFDDLSQQNLEEIRKRIPDFDPNNFRSWQKYANTLADDKARAAALAKARQLYQWEYEQDAHIQAERIDEEIKQRMLQRLPKLISEQIDKKLDIKNLDELAQSLKVSREVPQNNAETIIAFYQKNYPEKVSEIKQFLEGTKPEHLAFPEKESEWSKVKAKDEGGEKVKIARAALGASYDEEIAKLSSPEKIRELIGEQKLDQLIKDVIKKLGQEGNRELSFLKKNKGKETEQKFFDDFIKDTGLKPEVVQEIYQAAQEQLRDIARDAARQKGSLKTAAKKITKNLLGYGALGVGANFLLTPLGAVTTVGVTRIIQAKLEDRRQQKRLAQAKQEISGQYQRDTNLQEQFKNNLLLVFSDKKKSELLKKKTGYIGLNKAKQAFIGAEDKEAAYHNFIQALDRTIADKKDKIKEWLDKNTQHSQQEKEEIINSALALYKSDQVNQLLSELSEESNQYLLDKGLIHKISEAADKFRQASAEQKIKRSIAFTTAAGIARILPGVRTALTGYAGWEAGGAAADFLAARQGKKLEIKEQDKGVKRWSKEKVNKLIEDMSTGVLSAAEINSHLDQLIQNFDNLKTSENFIPFLGRIKLEANLAENRKNKVLAAEISQKIGQLENMMVLDGAVGLNDVTREIEAASYLSEAARYKSRKEEISKRKLILRAGGAAAFALIGDAVFSQLRSAEAAPPAGEEPKIEVSQEQSFWDEVLTKIRGNKRLSQFLGINSKTGKWHIVKPKTTERFLEIFGLKEKESSLAPEQSPPAEEPSIPKEEPSAGQVPPEVPEKVPELKGYAKIFDTKLEKAGFTDFKQRQGFIKELMESEEYKNASYRDKLTLIKEQVEKLSAAKPPIRETLTEIPSEEPTAEPVEPPPAGAPAEEGAIPEAGEPPPTPPDRGATRQFPPDRGARGVEEAAQAPVKAEVKGVSQNELIDLATIKKGEGVEHALIRQLKANPQEFGFKGDINNEAAVTRWAGNEAHKIAIRAGYIDVKTGAEIRVGTKGIGKAAYILEKDQAGKITVQEYFKKDKDFGLQETHELAKDYQSAKFEGSDKEPYEYEYTTKATPPEEVSPPAAPVEETVKEFSTGQPFEQNLQIPTKETLTTYTNPTLFSALTEKGYVSEGRINQSLTTLIEGQFGNKGNYQIIGIDDPADNDQLADLFIVADQKGEPLETAGGILTVERSGRDFTQIKEAITQAVVERERNIETNLIQELNLPSSTPEAANKFNNLRDTLKAVGIDIYGANYVENLKQIKLLQSFDPTFTKLAELPAGSQKGLADIILQNKYNQSALETIYNATIASNNKIQPEQAAELVARLESPGGLNKIAASNLNSAIKERLISDLVHRQADDPLNLVSGKAAVIKFDGNSLVYQGIRNHKGTDLIDLRIDLDKGIYFNDGTEVSFMSFQAEGYQNSFVKALTRLEKWTNGK
jgi:hypothetical protein